MIPKRLRRSGLDYLLVGTSCFLATYSVGMSLNSQGMATVLGLLSVASIFLGYCLSSLFENSKIREFDGWLWAIAAFTAIFYTQRLNAMLPDNGIPFNLIASGALCWMIIFAGVVSWRDATLLFLTLPCIAIFGLVGTFDTFYLATVFFFIFLVAIAVLYARVHQRRMIQHSLDLGVTRPDLLFRGEWRWMAGPEWALASAAVIIVISLVGAPVLRTTIQTVAPNVEVPFNAPPQAQQQGDQFTDASQLQRIGQGPGLLSEAEILEYRGPANRYVRHFSMSNYTGSGWRRVQFSAPADHPVQLAHSPNINAQPDGEYGGFRAPWADTGPALERLPYATEHLVQIRRLRRTTPYVFAPGPATEIVRPSREFTFQPSGYVTLRQPLGENDQLNLYVQQSPPPPFDAVAEFPPEIKLVEDLFTDTESIPARVQDFAWSAVRGAETDLQKAEAIRMAIISQVRYNLRAEAVPEGQDPIEHFLFSSQEGYCDLFASAMTAMARSVGLPARYTIGYLVNDPDQTSDGFMIFRAKDYHAWCEIYFDGYGWVVFDATEGADQVRGGERGGAVGLAVAWYDLAVVRIGFYILIAIVGFALIYFAFLNKPVGGSHKADPARVDLERMHSRFTRAIEKFTKSPKRFSQTTREFVTLHEENLGKLADDAWALVDKFEHYMFSKVTPQGEERSSLKSGVDAFLTQLKAEAKAK